MSSFLTFLRRVRQGRSCVSAWEARTPAHLTCGFACETVLVFPKGWQASNHGASPRKAHSEGLFCHVSVWLLTIAIRSDCRGSCKLHASLQQSGLRKSCAAHTPDLFCSFCHTPIHERRSTRARARALTRHRHALLRRSQIGVVSASGMYLRLLSDCMPTLREDVFL